jgi:hypothetical protein
LIIPEGVTLDRCFYLHNSEDLRPLLRDSDMVLYNNRQVEYKTTGATHEWTADNLTEVARMKNEMIDICLRANYDYYFLVDSDLILHLKTLANLLARNKEIVAGIFWTEWFQGSGVIEPNCWDLDTYTTENANRYRIPDLHETGGTGALILIKRDVLERGVNYTPIYNVSFSIYEDRAFCIRAACAGFQLYVDSTLPARHLYRRADFENYRRLKNENKS